MKLFAYKIVFLYYDEPTDVYLVTKTKSSSTEKLKDELSEKYPKYTNWLDSSADIAVSQIPFEAVKMADLSIVEFYRLNDYFNQEKLATKG